MRTIKKSAESIKCTTVTKKNKSAWCQTLFGHGRSYENSPNQGSYFEDHVKNRGALGGLLVDVAFKVDANFFLDDRPVGALFGIGSIDGAKHDVAGAGDQVAAVVAHESARNDFRLGFELSGVLVNCDDGDDNAVFGKMPAIANHHFFDFFQGTGIHQHATGGNRIAAERAILGKFNALAVFRKKDFAADHAQLVGQRSMPEQMPVLPVDGNEILRLDQLKKQLLLFLAGVTGDMNNSGGIVVIDQRPAAEHVVQHAENGLFVSRNDPRGKDDGVVFVHGNKAVVVHGDARERRHRLCLRAGSKDDDFARLKRPNVLRADHHAIGNAQVAEVVGDFDVVHHAAANEGHFTAHPEGDVNHLLNAVNGRRKAGKNNAARRRAREILDARNHGAFGWRVAGAFDVGGVGEKSEHAFVPITREGVNVESGAFHRSVVNLEIASVDDDALRRANRERDAIHRTVGDRDKFDFVGANFHATPGNHLAQRGGLEQAGFRQALFDQGECEAGSVNGYLQVAKDIGKRSDVILVTVGEDDGANVLTVLFQIGDIGDDQVDAEQLRLWEHHAGINHDDVVAIAQRHHIHAKFAETTERNYEKRLQRLAQRDGFSKLSDEIVSH